MKNLPLLLVLLLSCTLAQAQSTHRCAADALKQAKLLLLFHAGAGTNEADVGVDDTVKVLAPLRNPVNQRQLFDVLEVAGYVYRANYRMRLIYARVPGTCALMGQEIIERSSP
ncbi:hypothetical protein QTI66_24860 [Variovorax sp. J22R133]|uniref:hypothetical protein n=1 Tax=Variovorax brevis TaxID=3053503 RepID=UPI002574DA9A|nr:hypothetical protein [Variovorax sp. J22R133]MDM0115404.1 hypothetical protein [Variovorax sp. J22R133]